jgi:hypothetical protein
LWRDYQEIKYPDWLIRVCSSAPEFLNGLAEVLSSTPLRLFNRIFRRANPLARKKLPNDFAAFDREQSFAMRLDAHGHAAFALSRENYWRRQ